MSYVKYDFDDEEFVKKLIKRIKISYKRLAQTQQGADDCSQEIIARIIEGRHAHASIDHCVIDYLRTQNNYKNTFVPLAEELHGQIVPDAVVVDMPDRFKYAVFQLFYLWGFSIKELASIFKYSVSMIDRSLWDARKQLSRKMSL